MRTLKTFVALSCICLLLQSCCTSRVRKIGIETETLSSCKQVCIGNDGNIAVVVKSTLHNIMPYKSESTHRIIIGSPQALNKSVSSHSTRVNNLLNVMVNIVDTDFDGWHITHDRLYEKSDSFIILPKQLQNNFKNCTSCTFRYSINNINEEIFISKFAYNENWSHQFESGLGFYDFKYTIFLHYPSQFLLIPAVAFDTATAPFQFLFLLGVANQ